MLFNYDTNNLIFFHYPAYAGGKFVMNCMGLSDSMVLQSQSLAQAQIDGTFSFDDKKEYILSHMKNEDIKKGEWGDLELGCSQLFIDGADKSDTHWGLVYNIKTGKQHSSITDTARFLSSKRNNKWLFGLVCHLNYLPLALPNAKIIAFKNNTSMVNHRTSFLPVKHIFHNFTATVENGGWDEGITERVSDFTWDTEWLNDVSTTTEGIHKLYKLFNLDGWEQAEPFIKEYYHLWCKKNHLPISKSVK